MHTELCTEIKGIQHFEDLAEVKRQIKMDFKEIRCEYQDTSVSE